jgi:hypothetical protein
MRYIKVIAFLSLLGFSCGYEGVPFVAVQYEIGRSIAIPVDSINYSSKFQQVLQYGGSTRLFVLNKENEILIINLTTAEIENVIQMPFTGPGSVGEVTDFYAISEDSILLFNDYESILYLIDNDGGIEANWSFEGLTNKSAVAFTTYKEFRLQYRSGSIYLRTYPAVDPDDRTFYEEPFVGTIDLQSRTFKHQIDFPDYYLEANYSPVEIWAGLCINPSGVLLVSYPLDHDLYLFDVEKKSSVLAKSNFVPNDFLRLSGAGDLVEDRKYIKEQPFYFSVLYDSYRNLIYRIVKHSQTSSNNADLNYFDSSWSILVLNSAGEYLGEAFFEGSIYDFTNILVTSEGLLLSKEVDTNAEDRENYLEYDLIELKL